MSAKPKMREMVIDRNEWLRGVGENESCLWRKDVGAGCCLGHVARRLDRASLASIGTAALPEDMTRLLPVASAIASHKIGTRIIAASVNDDEAMTDAEREKQLIALFAKEGVRLRFTGPRVASLRRIRGRVEKHAGDLP